MLKIRGYVFGCYKAKNMRQMAFLYSQYLWDMRHIPCGCPYHPFNRWGNSRKGALVVFYGKKGIRLDLREKIPLRFLWVYLLPWNKIKI